MNHFNKFVIFALLFIFAACSTFSERRPANLDSEYTYGAELTFTNSEILESQRALRSGTINSDMSERYQKLLIDKILENCLDCSVEKHIDKYGLEYGRILYPDGWYFNVTLDPAVVEVTAKPIPDSKLQEYTKRLDRDLYANARELGLRPSRNTGGGHIHFGAQSFFEGNPEYFRDFMVDMYNHGELAEGIFADDHYNSPPIKAHPKAQRDAFIRTIEAFDNDPEDSIIGLGLKIREGTYDYQVANWGPTEKYQAINIERMVVEGFEASEETIEVRSIRPQQNGEQFALIANLFKKRMEYLKRQRKQGSVLKLNHVTGMTVEQKFQSFIRFITEADEDPADYFRILPAEYLDLAWKKLEQLYPGDLEKKILFISKVSQDAPFDDVSKARKALDLLTTLRNSHPLFVQDKLSMVIEVIKNSEEKFQKPQYEADLLARVEKFMNASAMPDPVGFLNSCKQILRNLSLPAFRAL